MALGQNAAGDIAEPGNVVPRASNCRLVEIAKWPVMIARSGLVVDGTVNGRKIGILLDTGATRTMMFRAAAERLNLTVRPFTTAERAQLSVWVAGSTGDSIAETTVVDELTIAGSTRRNWQMVVVGERDPGDGIGVVLGEDFFRNFDMEFDLSNRAIRFFQPRNCNDVSLAYWSTGQTLEVQFEFVGAKRSRILVPVRINGLPIVALFDTGANRSLVSRHVASRLGVRPDTPGVVAAGQFGGIGKDLSDAWIGPFESFEIGNEALKDTAIAFGNIGTEYQMLLGLDFLFAHRLLVSHTQRKIYFTYLGGPVFKR
jgi:predicted aspartyl protease